MSKKLGEILMERGLITGLQLESALRNQLMLGGHLGTCLLELGFVDEECLGRTLSEVHGVPYASPEVLSRVREPVTRSIPRRLVEEYQAIPLERTGQRLFVAMVNPRQLAARDALAFASGCKVVPWVAPEVRIFEALERLYGVPRRMRYLAISRAIAHVDRAPRRAAAQPVGFSAGRGIPERQRQAPEEVAGWGDDPHSGDSRPWREIASELFPDDVQPGDGNDAGTHPPAKRAELGSGLERAAERLCLADDADGVARAVLDAAATGLGRVALFSVKVEGLRIWHARGFDAGAAGRGVAPFPVASGGILGHLDGDEYYHGPLRDDSSCRSFFEWLGITPPAKVLLVPVHLNDRLVAVIYGDAGGRKEAGDGPESCVRLSRMLAYALTAIIYKNRIREIASIAGRIEA